MAAIASAQVPLQAEEKRIFKLKFAAKVGIAVANKGLDQFIADEPNS